MFGPISAFELIVILSSLIVVLTDSIQGKIYNWLTLPLILGGLIYSTCGGTPASYSFQLTLAGFSFSVTGIALGLLLYGWMFFIGFLGGGDVKFLMALGAWGGMDYVKNVAILAVLLGGAVAFVSLALRGKLWGFLKRLYFFLLSILVKELEPSFPKVDKNLTLPFGIPMAVAAIVTACFPQYSPLKFLW